ncbi:MAG: hypothetical protein OXE99_09640 [Cellvibrionales bacterium]|nr:hypothetical protein [Cellvibrionales bacterium]
MKEKILFCVCLIFILGCNYTKALSDTKTTKLEELKNYLKKIEKNEEKRSGGKGDALLLGGLFKHVDWDAGNDPTGMTLVIAAAIVLSAEIISAVPRLETITINLHKVDRAKYMLATIEEAESNKEYWGCNNITQLYHTVKNKNFINRDVTLDMFKKLYLKAVLEIYNKLKGNNVIKPNALDELTKQNTSPAIWTAFNKHYKKYCITRFSNKKEQKGVEF